MPKINKLLMAGVFVVAFLPLSLGFCCCVDGAIASLFSATKIAKSSYHDHCSGHKQGNPTQEKCEHDQLASNTPSEVLLITRALSATVSFTSNHADSFVYLTEAYSKTNFFDTGPSDILPTSIALYLRLSVLRI